MESRDAEVLVATPAPDGPLRVLHCEDMASDGELVERMLHRWYPPIEYLRVAGEAGFRGALRDNPPDLVLCDYTVPGFGGPAALRIAREASASMPFIFVSGTIGEDNAIESLRQGATDYVLKDRLARLIPAIGRALREARLRRHNEAAMLALAHHRRLLSGVLAALPDFIYAVDRDNRVIACNPRASQFLSGGSDIAAHNRLLIDLAPPGVDIRRIATENARLMAESRETYDADGWLVGADGSDRFLSVSKTPLRDLDSGELCGLVTVGRDITERLGLERAVLDASERERRSIGGDLHDGLGQELSGLGLLLAVVERSLGDGAPQARAALLRAQEVLRHAMATTRRLARGLAPIDLEEAGLAAALATLVERSSLMFGVECSLVATPESGHLIDPTVAAHLYRIAQEAIGNAARHGQAARIEVRLAPPPEPYLEIADNGTGFDADNPRPSTGMGLRLMRYRATIIGGLLSVDSDRTGTRIRCRIPDRPRQQ